MLDEHDHRQIGQAQGLFHFQEEAPGMAFWHPRGYQLFRLLEDAVRRNAREQGFSEVRTPQLMRRAIWDASGHWENFAADMFLVDEDDRPAALKPVNCPGHLQIMKAMAPSYRDLPLRISELGVVHRNEQSGNLAGLFRLRQFTQDDGHILCEESQVEAEVDRFCRGLQRFYAAFGFERIEVAFSSRPPVRGGDDALWDRAESMLRAAARSAGLDCVEQPGAGAFYGPKLEFGLRDRQGRPWQCGTIQLDLVMPERFGVHFVGRSGARETPAMLHRAVLGSLERFLGVLLEHHQGALPAWLAPEQVVVAPIAEAHRGYAQGVLSRLVAAGVRARLDARPESLGRRLAEAHAAGAALFVVLGQREVDGEAIALRRRDGSQRAMPLEEGLAEVTRCCQPPV